jgi:hypothetical protein
VQSPDLADTLAEERYEPGAVFHAVGADRHVAGNVPASFRNGSQHCARRGGGV